jgi:hypothetical protein
MNPVRSLARRPPRAHSIARSHGPSFSSDNPTGVPGRGHEGRERTARQYVAHLQRLARLPRAALPAWTAARSLSRAHGFGDQCAHLPQLVPYWVLLW